MTPERGIRLRRECALLGLTHRTMVARGTTQEAPAVTAQVLGVTAPGPGGPGSKRTGPGSNRPRPGSNAPDRSIKRQESHAEPLAGSAHPLGGSAEPLRRSPRARPCRARSRRPSGLAPARPHGALGKLPPSRLGVAILQRGDVFANCTIERLLGAGSIAEVYDRVTPEGATRALEILHEDAPLTSKLQARLAQGCDILAMSEHVNVVRFYDAGVEPPRDRSSCTWGDDAGPRRRRGTRRPPRARARREACTCRSGAHERRCTPPARRGTRRTTAPTAMGEKRSPSRWMTKIDAAMALARIAAGTSVEHGGVRRRGAGEDGELREPKHDEERRRRALRSATSASRRGDRGGPGAEPEVRPERDLRRGRDRRATRPRGCP